MVASTDRAVATEIAVFADVSNDVPFGQTRWTLFLMVSAAALCYDACANCDSWRIAMSKAVRWLVGLNLFAVVAAIIVGGASAPRAEAKKIDAKKMALPRRHSFNIDPKTPLAE